MPNFDRVPDELDTVFDDAPAAPPRHSMAAATLAFIRDEVDGYYARLTSVAGVPQGTPFAEILDSFLWSHTNPHVLNKVAYIAELAHLVARVDAADHEAAGKRVELDARDRIMWDGRYVTLHAKEANPKPLVPKTEAEKLVKDDPAVLRHDRIGRMLAAERDTYEVLAKALRLRARAFMGGIEEPQGGGKLGEA